jgi:hypothetical protein
MAVGSPLPPSIENWPDLLLRMSAIWMSSRVRFDRLYVPPTV